MKKETVEVTKTVDLKLNQSDLIDVLIEDYRQELETKIAVSKEYKADLLKEEKELSNILKEILIKQLGKKSEVYKRIHDLPETTWSVSTTDTAEKIGELLFVQTSYGKKALNNPDYTQGKTYSLYTPVSGKLYLGNKASDYYAFKCVEAKVDLTKELKEVLNKKRTLLKKQMVNDKELNDLEVDLLKVEYGEKRMKAQFIKASLGKSTEGKAILDLMNDVKKGVKLLS